MPLESIPLPWQVPAMRPFFWNRDALAAHSDLTNVNPIKVTDVNSHATHAMNRKTATIDGNGRRTETKYDLASNAISVTNDSGRVLSVVISDCHNLLS
jgi:YD repeat-containing protein